jgi:hypothetical protein
MSILNFQLGQCPLKLQTNVTIFSITKIPLQNIRIQKRKRKNENFTYNP